MLNAQNQDSPIRLIREYLDQFANRRGWDQYRNIKNLCMALSVEVGELIEIFQWKSMEDSQLDQLDAKTKEHIEEELADILSYLIQISGKMDIDLVEAFWKKTKKNEAKYPIK